jgi:ubiquinone/menaquinone biosynthesis C-methylase UbiE
MMSLENEIKIQRRYYAETAHRFNEMHVHASDEHSFALSFLVSFIDYSMINSVLDVGSGTGRALLYLKSKRPDLKILGIEPVKEQREVGYNSGLSREELIQGDATNLEFGDASFDLVCEFGMLHHIKYPEKAILEMLRVAKKAIFISDSNNFGQGSLLSRSIKQLLNSLRLWKLADYIKTGGRGYSISNGDGLAYSYSVFNNYNSIKKYCKNIHILNTENGGMNLYKTASHVALLGIKK